MKEWQKRLTLLVPARIGPNFNKDIVAFEGPLMSGCFLALKMRISDFSMKRNPSQRWISMNKCKQLGCRGFATLILRLFVLLGGSPKKIAKSSIVSNCILSLDCVQALLHAKLFCSRKMFKNVAGVVCEQAS